MNIKNNCNLTKTHFPVEKVIAFYPEPDERMGDKELHRTIIYNRNGNRYPQEVPVRQSFENYAARIAFDAGVSSASKVWTKTPYGFQLVNGDTFIKLAFQSFAPMEGYIDLFAIRSLYLNPSMGTTLYMNNGLQLSSTISVQKALEKIYNAQNFYDPQCLRHPRGGIPFVFADLPSAALPEPIRLGGEGESDLLLTTERDVRLALAICKHINAMSPTKMCSGVEGLCKRLTPRVEQFENVQKIRAEGLAAGHGAPPVIAPKTAAVEETVSRAVYDAVVADRDQMKEIVIACMKR